MSSEPAASDEIATANAPQGVVAACPDWRFDVAGLASKYRPFLKTIAAAEFPDHLRSREDESDVVQETLLKAIRQADQFRGATEKELEAWLRETLLNQIRDRVRFHGRQQRDVAVEVSIPVTGVSASDPTASEQVRSAEMKELIQRALHELPQDYRTVLLLRQQMDLSFVEISEQMERTPDAVRMLWGRAILVLAEKLKSLR